MNKQNKNRLRYREHFDSCQMGGGWGLGERMKGFRSTN